MFEIDYIYTLINDKLYFDFCKPVLPRELSG